MTEREASTIDRVAKALDDNYKPDKYPIMSAMFRDYAATATKEVIRAVEAHIVGVWADGTYEAPDKTFTAHEIRQALWELYDNQKEVGH